MDKNLNKKLIKILAQKPINQKDISKKHDLLIKELKKIIKEKR
ncbi:hypothetical protein OSSY52_08390 [Tepiditoga spiralis]|uniref:Uncharacterized protein n=1 Tax=Tepiditoga spiralis TaxID=2108365 RepID=A0A7G1G2W7_9BACT|nr:hypothetical protein [Tepiditoga spiralis]BBE30698.1 hypothetical protein OSSY52_08390 [Tepiditoga spiralis]